MTDLATRENCTWQSCAADGSSFGASATSTKPYRPPENVRLRKWKGDFTLYAQSGKHRIAACKLWAHGWCVGGLVLAAVLRNKPFLLRFLEIRGVRP